MFQEKSMLVDLTIHRWTATKHDRAVSAEIEKTHSAHDAGRYNKQLIDKAHLKLIDELGNEIRKYHYHHTLPWTDKGARLLPSKLFFDYRDGLNSLKHQRQSAVNDFLKIYPDLVQAARVRLNTMFQPEDYPSVNDLRTAFGVELEIMPVPDAGDFRVDIAKDAQDEVREQIMASLRSRQDKAVKDIWVRVRETVGNVVKQCSNPKGRIYDSLMDNVLSLSTVIDGLNITGDVVLEQIGRELRELHTEPELVRNFQNVRAAVSAKAEQILLKVPEV
jgi:hypothetical protein